MSNDKGYEYSKKDEQYQWWTRLLSFSPSVFPTDPEQAGARAFFIWGSGYDIGRRVALEDAAGYLERVAGDHEGPTAQAVRSLAVVLRTPGAKLER